MRLLKICLVLALVVMGLRAFDLQILRSHQYQRAASLQLRTTLPLPAVRGGIFDRNGAVLAMSVPTKEVIADDFQISHPVQEARRSRRCSGFPPFSWRRCSSATPATSC